MGRITAKRIIKAAVPYGGLVLYRRAKPLVGRVKEGVVRQKTINMRVSGILSNAKHVNTKSNPEIIVSLTSYGYRIKRTTPIAVASLLRQDVMPDKLILWLAYGEKAPRSLKRLRRYGLEIRYCDEIRSYKKLVPTLEEYPNSVIVTADDDVEYPADWLSKMITAHKKNPEAILAHRARKITITDRGAPAAYENWPLLEQTLENSHLILPNGIGGVLYPPNSLSKKVFSKELFMTLSPSGDDLWFWAMAELKGTKRVLIKNGYKNISDYELDATGLWNTINQDKVTGNDAQFVQLLEHFPKLIKNIGATKARETGFLGSARYWEDRYAAGDNSGTGSYDNLAQFKSQILNKFVKQNNIKTVIEFGSGDGNQLLTAEYPHYVGFDVSKTAIAISQKLFERDKTKEFYTLDEFIDQKADLAMSLDVLYHLVEENVFRSHIESLFKAAKKYVIIYAFDGDGIETADHVKSRKFTDFIEQNIQGWKLVKHIPNDYPYDETNPHHTTWADFYIYEMKK